MIKLHLISIRRRNITFSLLMLVVVVLCIEVFSLTGFIGIGKERDTSAELVDSGLNVYNGGKLAIIIDDFGQDRSGVKEMMLIDRHLTFAVMPFLEYSRSDAESAYNKGYEVIVHLPMEPNHGKLSWLGPRPILSGMSKNVAEQIVRDAFENVPYAVGANIHMGSKASSDEIIITSILDIIKEKNLYFVDSRTASNPISKRLADTRGVRCFERDIFIDEGRSKEGIKNQLRKCEEVIFKKGTVIAVGHVGAEGGKVTAKAISEMLPEFDRNNIELVFVSELSE